MIKITDWVAVIPEEDKRIAYVGENDSETRQFLLTGEDANTYKDWGFHLDMAFDLSTVTQVSTHRSETIHESQNENISETATSLTATTTRESRDITNVAVDCANPTDVVTLTKRVTAEGLLLTWHILRQHTMLPGKLRANLRAINKAGQVKKSAMMVFDVEAAVTATPAATISLSEFEQLEQRMDTLVDSAESVTVELEELVPKAKQDAQAAIEAAEAAAAAAEKAETTVESIYERNNKLPVSLWVGTQEEYDAIEEKEFNRLYIVGDDEPLAALQSRMTALEEAHGLNTYKSLIDIGITAFPTTMSAVVAAMPAYSMLMMDTRHIKNTESKDDGDQIISDWGNTRNGIAIIMKGKDKLRVSLMVVHSSGQATTTALDYGNYAGYDDRVNWNTMAIPADYVLEQGDVDGWTYRKWNSGLYECWARFTASVVDITTPWGALYRSEGGLIVGEYPIAFVEPPHVTVTIHRPSSNIGDTAAFLIPYTAGTATVPPDYHLCHARELTGIDANIHVSVVGYWKEV